MASEVILPLLQVQEIFSKDVGHGTIVMTDLILSMLLQQLPLIIAGLFVMGINPKLH